jgi:sugar (pentulose or hexulose) kinase
VTGLVCGVDVATQDVRVAVLAADGTVRARGAAPLPPPERPAPGRAEQDPRAWWPAVAAALRQTTAALGAERDAIRALAVASTSGTIAITDAAGDPLGPALMYDDRRAEAEARVAQEAGAGRWDRLGIRIGPGFALAKLAVLARTPGARRACHTADLIAWRLTGAPTATDSSHALKTGFDALAWEWPHEALAALGIDPALLPEVQRPTTPVGTVSACAATLTGLPETCEVRLGMTDGCAGQIACGATRLGERVTVLGTTLVLKAATGELARDPSGVVYCHRHPDGHWLPGGASNTGGEALSDVPRDRLAALDEAAARRGPASVIGYPLRRAGERFPFLAPDARGFTLGTPADAADAHRSALEGVAFLERLAYERLARLGVPESGTVSTTGGGSRSDVWTAIRATVLGTALRRVPEASSAAGAAQLAAAGTLHPDLESAAGAMVHPGTPVDPVEAEREPLGERYEAFVAALSARGWLPSS